MTFTTLAPRESAVAACAREIRTAILRGELAPGERLPPERELASRFGVNRVTVRSALAQLEARRLLTVRQGSGYLVRRWRRDGGPDLLPAIGSLAKDRGSLAVIARDLLRVRRHLARAVLESLVESADDAGVAAVTEAVLRFEQAAASGAAPAEMAVADVEVVAALLDATGSPVLQLCLNPIAAVLSELPALRDAMYRDPPRNAAGYRLLLGWLATRRLDLVDTIVAELVRNDQRTLAELEARRDPPSKPSRTPQKRSPTR